MKRQFYAVQQVEVKLTTLQLVRQAYAWAVQQDQSRRNFDRALNMISPAGQFLHREKPRIRIVRPGIVQVELFSSDVREGQHPEAGG